MEHEAGSCLSLARLCSAARWGRQEQAAAVAPSGAETLKAYGSDLCSGALPVSRVPICWARPRPQIAQARRGRAQRQFPVCGVAE
eukprot:6197417-Prymnesium_polylepis.1